MPAKTTTVQKRLIPYRAGAAAVTPLDDNMRPIYTQSVMTEETFIASTQTSVTNEVETIESGNGSNVDVVTSETYTVTVTTNAYNPVFHNMVAGRLEYLPTSTIMKDTFTHNLPAAPTGEETYLEITFGAGKDHETEPAPDPDGNYNFVVEDSYGNPLKRMDTPQFGAYSYDVEGKALQFSTEYANAEIRVAYDYNEKNALVYKSDPILKRKLFKIDIFGISRDAVGGTTYRYETTIERAYLTGDLTEMPTQASANSPMTYTFNSAPVPTGVSVYTQKLAPYMPGGDGSGDSAANIVNGGDDNFTTPVGP